MWTLLLIILPLLFAAVVFTGKDPVKTRKMAILLAFSQLVFTIPAMIMAGSNDWSLLHINFPWMQSVGASFDLSPDGIGIWMILLTNLVMPLALISAGEREISRPGLFYGLLFITQSALLGVFSTHDILVFYIFWELTLIPLYFVCSLWGGEDRVRITMKFFIYTLLGSLAMLFALLFVYFKTPGANSFSFEAFYNAGLSPGEQIFVFFTLFFGFAVKIPVFPFHSWQPDTYTMAPYPATIILSALMLKMGLYGMIEILLPVCPMALPYWGNVVVILSLAGLLYASIIALRQQDMKRLLAWSSMAHVGLISAGIATAGQTAIEGAVIQMFAHGIYVAGLLYVVALIEESTSSRKLSDLGGLASAHSPFTVLFMLFLLASVALPSMLTFIGEFFLLLGLFAHGPLYALIGGSTVVFGIIYMLRMFRKSMLGERSQLTAGKVITPGPAIIFVFLLAVFLLFSGLYPSLITDIASPSINNLMLHF